VCKGKKQSLAALGVLYIAPSIVLQMRDIQALAAL
jgi:hypothetical protein